MKENNWTFFSSVRDADETSTVGSHDSGNGFDLNNDDQVTDLVLSFVRKFVDKICDESGVNTTHKNSLHTKLYRTFIFFWSNFKYSFSQ